MELYSSLSKIKTTLSGFILSSLTVSFLCMGLLPMFTVSHRDMGHGSHQVSTSLTTSDCCNSGINDHAKLWKNTFIGIAQEVQKPALQLVVFVTFTFSDFFKLPQQINVVLSQKFRQYAREHPDIELYNPLHLAFAKGILNPKLF